MKLIRILFLTAVSYLTINNSVMAQLSIGGTPVSFEKTVTTDIPAVVMPAIDVAALLAEDEKDAKEGIPYRFGYPFEVDYTLNNSGIWEKLNDGSKLWRLRIECPGAYSINLIYDNFWLPEGARFYIYNEDHSMIIGAFTSQNNKEHNKFSTAPVKGNVSILELYVPADVSYPGEINIQGVVHAYKNIFSYLKGEKGFGSSGACNNNVHCPEGEPWEEEIRSVVMILLANGTRWCSGTMINYVREDLTPYFLTANHCLSGEETWVFMFNYESPTCDNINGPTWMSVSGSTLLATSSYSDFALLLLSEQPPDSYNVFYAGWSAIDTAASSVVGIHHPSGDIKKISFDYDPVTSTDYGQNSGSSHWRIGQWEDGTTEPGSSGSPIFDPDHHLVGQLHGGSASCQSITSDWYGKFSKSWNHGSSPSSRLKDWLDPDNTGTLILDGLDATGITFSADSTTGWVPFEVNFTATSKFPVDEWTWDFGDGDSAFIQNPSHIYIEPGSFDVKLEISSGGDTHYRLKQNYIAAIADTIIGNDVEGSINSSVELTVYARNNFPIETMKIPVDYSGQLPLAIDSFSTVGCRTEYFNIQEYSHFDPFFKRATITLRSSNDGSQPELLPGSGDIIKLYFSILPSAQTGQSTVINFDGYSFFLPFFYGSIVNYQPWTVPGSVTSTGCCLGIRGNIDYDDLDEINIADLVYYVDFSFGDPSGPEPPCFEEADVDSSSELNIADIVYLVNYMFNIPAGLAPLDCP